MRRFFCKGPSWRAIPGLAIPAAADGKPPAFVIAAPFFPVRSCALIRHHPHPEESFPFALKRATNEAAKASTDFMRTFSLNHRRPLVLVTLLAALGLLLAGTRVPDLSRPHRPRPIHRILCEKHHKTSTAQLQQQSDVVAVLPSPLLPGRCTTYAPASPAVPPMLASAPSPSGSGRSPPTL